MSKITGNIPPCAKDGFCAECPLVPTCEDWGCVSCKFSEFCKCWQKHDTTWQRARADFMQGRRVRNVVTARMQRQAPRDGRLAGLLQGRLHL